MERKRIGSVISGGHTHKERHTGPIIHPRQIHDSARSDILNDKGSPCLNFLHDSTEYARVPRGDEGGEVKKWVMRSEEEGTTKRARLFRGSKRQKPPPPISLRGREQPVLLPHLAIGCAHRRIGNGNHKLH